MRFAILAAAALLTAGAASAATYKPDPGHTEVMFFWDHAGVSEQSGEFLKVDASVTFDPEAIDATTISATIDAASISTGVGPLDEHLKKADFFEVDKFPEITFVSTGIRQTGPDTAEIVGDLTIKGITKPITLQAQVVHQGEHPLGAFIDYYKGDWIGVHADAVLVRSEWDLGMFAPLTSDKITLRISTEMKAE